jgi:hypothetical protein
MRDDIACFHDKAVAMRGKKCEALVCLTIGHVTVFEPQYSGPHGFKIDRANDWPVVGLGVDLDHVDLRQSGSTERAFDRVAGDWLRDDVCVGDSMATEVITVERRRHRHFAALTEKIPGAFGFGDRGLQQRNVRPIPIGMLQLGERSWLRFNEDTAQLVLEDQTAKVVFADSIVGANLEECETWIAQQLMRYYEGEVAPHDQPGFARDNRWRVAALDAKLAKENVSPAAPHVDAKPLRCKATTEFTKRPPADRTRCFRHRGLRIRISQAAPGSAGV